MLIAYFSKKKINKKGTVSSQANSKNLKNYKLLSFVNVLTESLELKFV
jgi:hypothetical protein